jgi:chromosome segregation ATPase
MAYIVLASSLGMGGQENNKGQQRGENIMWRRLGLYLLLLFFVAGCFGVKIKKLKKENQRLELQIEEHQKLQTENEKLKNKNGESNEKDKEINKLQTENEKLKKEGEKTKELQTENEQLKKEKGELRKKDEEIKKLQNKNEKLQTENQKLKNKNGELQNKNGKLNDQSEELDEKDEQINKLKKENQKLKKEKGDLEAKDGDLETKNQENQKLKKENQENEKLKNKIKELKNKNQKLNDKINELNEKINELKNKNGALEHSIEFSDDDGVHHDVHHECNKKYEELTNDSRAINEKFQILTEAIKELGILDNNTLLAWFVNNNHEDLNIKEKIEDNLRLKNKSRELEAKKEQKLQLETKIDKLNDDINEKIEEIKELQNKNKKLKNKNKKLKKENEKSDNKINQQSEDINALYSQINGLKDCIKELKKEIKEKEDMINELTEKERQDRVNMIKPKDSDELKKVKKELSESRDREDELCKKDNDYLQHKQEIDNLKDKIIELTEKREYLEEENRTVVALGKQIKKLRLEINRSDLQPDVKAELNTCIEDLMRIKLAIDHVVRKLEIRGHISLMKHTNVLGETSKIGQTSKRELEVEVVKNLKNNGFQKEHEQITILKNKTKELTEKIMKARGVTELKYISKEGVDLLAEKINKFIYLIDRVDMTISILMVVISALDHNESYLKKLKNATTMEQLTLIVPKEKLKHLLGEENQ